MKILDIEQNSDEWLLARKGKITGSKLKNIVVEKGTNEKIGFWQLLADSLSIEDESESENPRERGHEFEPNAIQEFEKITGKKVKTTGMWISDENENIACSPDGVIGKTEAVEVKCLSASRHLEAYFTQKIPSEYKYQVLQYFIVNEKLEKLYFCFYDPRIVSKPFFFIEVERDEEDVEYYKNYQLGKLAKIEEYKNQLMAF
jgi:putative phage-type endonuclease